MVVTAKFKVVSKTEHAVTGDNRQCDIVLRPDYSGGGNEAWSKATPSGELKMMVTNPDAINALELGSQYIITFEKAE